MSKKQHSFYKLKGKKVFIRSVTHHYTGLVIDVTKKDLVLAQAAWVADDGRFNDFLKDPVNKVEEVEPYPNDVIITLGSIIDATTIKELPREQK